MAPTLQDVHDVELVFGEHLRETTCALDRFDQRGRLVLLPINQVFRAADVANEPDLHGGFLRDGQRVTGYHFYAHTHLASRGDSGRSVGAGRVEQGQYSQESPRAVGLGAGHAQ